MTTTYVTIDALNGVLTNSGVPSVAVGGSAPTVGQTLVATDSKDATWQTPTTGGAPTGAAGGDLGGTYPNPTLAKIDGYALPNPGSNVGLLQSSGSALTWGTVAASSITAGTANQILINNATPTPAWTTLSGDVTNVLGVMTVNSISGSSPINITPANLQWLATTTSPTLLQAAATSDVVPQNLTIQPQGPFLTASTHKLTGNIILNVVSTTANTTTLTNAVSLQSNSTEYVKFYPNGVAGATTSIMAFASGGQITSSSNIILKGTGGVEILGGSTLIGDTTQAYYLQITPGASTTYFYPAAVTSVSLTHQAAASVATATGTTGAPHAYTAQTGGATTVASGTGTGGAGSSITYTAGVGGAPSGAATTNAGGAGGALNLTAGTGGAASGATTNNGGAGGNLVLTAGIGGTGTQTNGKGGLVSLVGGLKLTTLSISASTYTIDANSTTSDLVVLVDSTSNTVNVTIPVTSGRPIIIKDKGHAATHNVTLTPASGTIDGASTLVFTKNYDSAIVIGDGTNLFVLSLTSTSIVP